MKQWKTDTSKDKFSNVQKNAMADAEIKRQLKVEKAKKYSRLISPLGADNLE